MCGILGSFDVKDSVSKEEFSRVLGQFEHRGPDQNAVSKPTAGLLLGHNRLSILDITSKGKQPMLSKNGRYTIVFNGEIYNYSQLKNEYLSDYVIRNDTDTEIILALLERFEFPNVMRLLNGMFAIAVFDIENNKLYLSRDYFGEKPLYYSINQSQKRLAFSSSINAVRALINDDDLNCDAVVEFLSYGYISERLSIYKSIDKVQPMSYLVINLRDFEVKSERYEQLNYGHDLEVTDISGLELHLENELETVIQSMLTADVEVGTFLSGGVDSSLVTAIAAKYKKDLKTFSVGFSESSYDESLYSRSVANHLGVYHRSIKATPKNCMEILQQLPNAFEEPFADSSQIPTMLVSATAKEELTVCLTGDGADELFSGYPRYKEFKKLDKIISRVPSFARSALSEMLSSARLKLLLSGITIGERTLNESNLMKIKKMLEEDSISSKYYSILKREFKNEINYVFDRQSETSDVRLCDVAHYLPSDILTKVDRAAMFYSLETRAPFLDKRISKIAFSKQHNQLIDDQYQKNILKNILYKYLPKQLFERNKAGFSLPIGEWVRSEWREYVVDIYNSKSLIDDICRPEIQQEVLCSVLDGENEHLYKLWDIFVFKQWEQSR